MPGWAGAPGRPFVCSRNAGHAPPAPVSTLGAAHAPAAACCAATPAINPLAAASQPGMCEAGITHQVGFWSEGITPITLACVERQEPPNNRGAMTELRTPTILTLVSGRQINHLPDVCQ